jgi:hypothetical protein
MKDENNIREGWKMSLEIIRRKEGELSQKQEIRHEHTQFSLNSYGHLCIREFEDKKKGYACDFGGFEKCINSEAKAANGCTGYSCMYYKSVLLPGEEHLIVLDQKTTDGLIKFIFENRSTYELKELLKGIIKSELPF